MARSHCKGLITFSLFCLTPSNRKFNESPKSSSSTTRSSQARKEKSAGVIAGISHGTKWLVALVHSESRGEVGTHKDL
jgi:hypothetical protein